MRISTWITSLYICGLISVNKVVGDNVLYGGSFTLYCGGSLPGEWFLNDRSTGVNSNNYTITNANFSHDGEYQCKRNGIDALGKPLEVIVYGRRSITALNCNSMSSDVCVRNAIRGQPVTLCASFTTIPPRIPKGERVSNLSASAWYKNGEGDNVYLYGCTTSSCEPDSSLDRSPYTYVNISCLTVNDVQENQQYTMFASFDPQHSPHPSVIFDVTYETSPTSSPTSSPPPTSSINTVTIPTSTTNTTVKTGPLETSVPSPGAPIPAIVLPIIVVLVIVIIVVVVILAAVFKYQNRKRFSLSMINGSKLRNSQATLQSPDIIPSKLDSGNHVNRPHLLPVNGHVLGGDGCTDTPGSQHCLLPQSPGNLNESSPVTYNGTSPQSLPPPPYSFVLGSPSKGNSRDQLTLDLGTTLSQPNDDEEVDVGDFGAGPLGEPKTVQIKP